MRPALFIVAILSLTFRPSSARSQGAGPTIEKFGVGTSFNAVIDEVVLGIHIDLEKNVWNWKHGSIHIGASSFYGAFPNTSQKINQFIEGRTSLIQPAQLYAGHLFHVFDRRLLLRSSILAGPSVFLQKIAFKDSNNGIYDTYRYREVLFTAHSRVGIGTRIGQHSHVDLYLNLPLINRILAPFGIGLALSRDLKRSTTKKHPENERL